jgi:hypothetical protein
LLRKDYGLIIHPIHFSFLLSLLLLRDMTDNFPGVDEELLFPDHITESIFG